MRKFFLFFSILSFFCSGLASPSFAATPKHSHKKVKHSSYSSKAKSKTKKRQRYKRKARVNYIKTEYSTSTIVVNLDDGKILFEKNSTDQKYPASLVKMMTLYLTFKAINSGEIKFDDIVTASKDVEKQPSSQINLRRGDKISVKDLITSVIVHSANDSAYALAEYIGGSADTFVEKMNNQAMALKMYSTIFRNPNGLHDKDQITTARDVARLAMSLWHDFPEYYHMFSETQFKFKDRMYITHNHVLTDYDGATGLKTGYVQAAGFNIASTAKKNGKNILTVVLNTPSSKQRDIYAMELLNYGFEITLDKKLADRNTIIDLLSKT